MSSNHLWLLCYGDGTSIAFSVYDMAFSIPFLLCCILVVLFLIILLDIFSPSFIFNISFPYISEVLLCLFFNDLITELFYGRSLSRRCLFDNHNISWLFLFYALYFFLLMFPVMCWNPTGRGNHNFSSLQFADHHFYNNFIESHHFHICLMHWCTTLKIFFLSSPKIIHQFFKDKVLTILHLVYKRVIQ